MSAKLIQVIACDEARRGSGLTSRDPMRVVLQYWSTDGNLLAEVDPTRRPQDFDRLEKAAQSLVDSMYEQKMIGMPVKGALDHLVSVLNGSQAADE